jgi:hypothetical protein
MLGFYERAIVLLRAIEAYCYHRLDCTKSTFDLTDEIRS